MYYKIRRRITNRDNPLMAQAIPQGFVLEGVGYLSAQLPVVVNKVVASLQAASLEISGAALSGLSHTSSFNFQFRVAPDQRSGQRCFAAS